MRIWILSKVLGWPGRRVASEVGVSQPTVVRTLERLQNDPPTDEEMQEFVNIGTPPKGLPVLNGKGRPSGSIAGMSPLMMAYTGAVISIALAITLVLVALAVSILTH